MSTTTAEETTSSSNIHIHKDHTGARIGMWLFLLTEILLFGGLFLLYSVYRTKFPQDFHYCAGTLDIIFGAANTVILLTSSLTMVLSVVSLEKENRKLASLFLVATIILAFVFLTNKYFEWSAKFHHGIYPNSEILQQHTQGENIFYGLYFLMTGLHGLHIIIGIIILSVMLFKISRTFDLTPAEEKSDSHMIQLENSGLYWHMVDIIWIFLFPLFYLIT
jgi:cytochrome c oxidase subunit III